MGLAPASRAYRARSARIATSDSPMTAGRLRLKIPAFSHAICSRVSPRYSTWSMPIDTTPAASGSSTLVASRRPPSPTSTTDTSTPARANISNAIAVVASKKVAWSASTIGSRRPIQSTTASSVTGVPSIRMRSRKSTRCGELYTPTRTPARLSSASSVAHTLPLPFVPPTWNACSDASGRSIAPRRACMRSRPSFHFPVVRANK